MPRFLGNDLESLFHKLEPAEQARLRSLDSYDVLDTAPEPQYDRIVRIAARMFGVPISLVTIIDASRQWFKAKVGIEGEETPRSLAFCHYTIQTNGPLVVRDATTDERFANNPYVTSGPNVRFYAGAPLTMPDGHRLGALCVVDSVPRDFPPESIEALQDLAGMVVDELELGRLKRALDHIGTQDPLTGVANQRHFFAQAEKEVARTRRRAQPMTLMTVALDKLDSVRETVGEETADRATVGLAKVLQRTLRAEDVLGRNAEDDLFMVLLPYTAADQAKRMAERAAAMIRRTRLLAGADAPAFTVSVGLSEVDKGSPDFQAAIRSAEAAVHAARQAGGKRIIVL